MSLIFSHNSHKNPRWDLTRELTTKHLTTLNPPWCFSLIPHSHFCHHLPKTAYSSKTKLKPLSMFGSNNQTSIASPEFISILNHTKLISELKEIQCRSHKSHNYSIMISTWKDMNQKPESALTNISWDSAIIPTIPNMHYRL